MKIKFLLTVMTFSFTTLIHAQKNISLVRASSAEGGSSYTTGFGIRLGYESGLTIKHFFKSSNAIEGILSTGWGYGGFRITGLYEYQKAFSGAKGLNWFVGGGLHFGSYTGRYYGYYGYYGSGYYDKHGNWHPTGYKERYASVGFDLILGLEYQFDGAPFTIGLDIKPYFDFYGRNDHYADGALTLRYILK